MSRSCVPSAHEHIGVVSEWRSDKGYGFLDFNGKRVFLHRRDLEKAGPPQIGEKLRFTFGADAEGRMRAENATPLQGSAGKVGVLSMIVLMALLILPGKALLHLRMDPAWIVAVVLGINLLTYASYASDKRRARTNGWRIPEGNLHLLELLGGWPAAWIAQRRLRHKVSKQSYQTMFWLILLVHQAAAYDALQDWRWFAHLVRRLTA